MARSFRLRLQTASATSTARSRCARHGSPRHVGFDRVGRASCSRYTPVLWARCADAAPTFVANLSLSRPVFCSAAAPRAQRPAVSERAQFNARFPHVSISFDATAIPAVGVAGAVVHRVQEHINASHPTWLARVVHANGSAVEATFSSFRSVPAKSALLPPSVQQERGLRPAWLPVRMLLARACG